MATVRILQILPNPLLDIGDLWEGITRCFLTRVELSETNAEADLINIRVGNQVISRRGDGWVDKKLKQSLGGKAPTLGIAINEGLRFTEGLGERYYSSLAVGRSCKFLCIRQDNCQVDGFEDTK